MKIKEKISVIIPWCDISSIKKTLQVNDLNFQNHCNEVIIVNSGGNMKLLKECFSGLNFDKFTIFYNESGNFNKALALNIGLHQSSSQVVVFLDADVEISECFLHESRRLAGGSFLTLARVCEAGAASTVESGGIKEIEYSLKISFKDHSDTSVITKCLFMDVPSRNGPGILSAQRSDLLQIEGMNSDCNGWGWEDIDLIFRLQHGLDLVRKQVGYAVHYGSDTGGSSEDHQDKNISEALNFAICLSRYQNYNFRGTLRRDVREIDKFSIIHV